MPITVLLTGFGPFPGAPHNPTGPLVEYLAGRHRATRGARRVAHVFETSYAAVDRDLPALIARERPDIVLMFGLAQRTKHVRIETCARNVVSRKHADVVGALPSRGAIVATGPQSLALRVPARELVAAVRNAGVSAALSRDAGSYLCNYLCWRASEAAVARGSPRLVAFVHVPNVRPAATLASRGRRGAPATFGDLVRAGEALVAAAVEHRPLTVCADRHGVPLRDAAYGTRFVRV
jgi:pyroglutamyl-peptidase